MEEKSPQSKRLQEFVELTGYSVNEFAKQCLIPSTRTLTRILTDGGKPSSKILDKIIKRFPQLNHDWVVLGYGEMIVKGFENREVTAESLQKSTQSSFGNIQQSLSNHDYSLNELAKRVDKAITRVETISEFLTNLAQESQKVMKANAELHMSKIDTKLQELDNFMTQMTVDIQMGNIINREKDIELINSLDEKRRELAKKDFDTLFKEFDRLSNITKTYLDDVKSNLHNDLKMEAQKVLAQSLEALATGFQSVKENSDKNTKEALEKLGALNRYKKP
jgi:transcriptional regulator with XRE-family HTH domain